MLAEYAGAKHAISCASGTDALLMVLMAKNIGPGDAVLCPSFTFCATGEVVALLSATPVFVDVDETTFNIDLASLQRGLDAAIRAGLKPRAIIPVDLFGQPADHDAVAAFAKAHDLFVLDDAAQGFGGLFKGKRIGTFGLATATSFFRPSRLAVMAMAARSSPMTMRWLRFYAAFAYTGRAATNTTMSASASPRGWIRCKPRS